MQGVSCTELLNLQLYHDLTALMCAPLDFIRDASGGDKTFSMGTALIQWGPQVSGLSQLDSIANVYGAVRQ